MPSKWAQQTHIPHRHPGTPRCRGTQRVLSGHYHFNNLTHYYSSDILAIAQDNIISTLRSRLNSRGTAITDRTQYYAYRSFAGFMAGMDVPMSEYNECLMSEWASWMFYEGHSRNTVLCYLRLIYALCSDRKYVKDLQLKNSHLATVKRIKELPDAIFRQNVGNRVIHRLQRLLEQGRNAAGDTRLAIDMTTFAILAGGLTFRQLADWKKDDPLPDSRVLHTIHDRYAAPRRRYLFPLGQSELTPQQIARRLTELFRRALGLCGLGLAADPAATAADLWLTAIYETTGSLQRAVDITGQTSRTAPAFALLKPAPSDNSDSPDTMAQRPLLYRQVRDTIVNDPVQWHVMRLRPGVTHERLMQRISDEDQSARLVRVYNPMVEIARRAGRKIVFDNRPAIPGLTFFMSRQSDITPLFRRIGDIAWCYRTGRGPGAPYATISDAEMHSMQQAIAGIDSDTMILPVEATGYEPGDTVECTVPGFEPGDRIMINAGAMAGHFADVTLVEKRNGEYTYRLTFPTAASALTWTVPASRLPAIHAN